MANLDEIQIKISQDSSGASKAIDSLIDSLEKLSTKTDLGTAAGNIKTLGDSLITLTKASQGFNAGDIASQLKSIPEAMKSLGELPIGEMQKFTDTVQSLSDVLEPLSQKAGSIATVLTALNNLPAPVQKAILNNKELEESNKKVSLSFKDVASATMKGVKSIVSWGAIVFVGKKIQKSLELVTQYTQTVNMLNTVMGEGAKEAKEFAENLGDVLGINPADVMNFQATFQNLFVGFGNTADQAQIMSKNLTQLSYDMAAFYAQLGGDPEAAAEKLRLGMAGTIEPIQRLGYAIKEADLQAVAARQGLNVNIRNLNTASKSMLRYIAIMEQSTHVQGYLTKSYYTPSTAILLFKSSIKQLTTEIGKVFLPVLIASIPYIQAFVHAVINAVQALVNFMGIKLPTINWEESKVGISGIGDEAEKTGKKIQKAFTLGIDELNILDSSTSDAASGMQDITKDLTLSEYDMLKGFDTKKVGEDLVKPFEEILKLVGLIGLGIAAWKISSGISTTISELNSLSGNSSKLNTLKQTVGVTMMVSGIALDFSGAKALGTGEGNWMNAVETALGAALTLGGSLLAFGTTPLGWAVGIGLAITATITGLAVGAKENLSAAVEEAFFADKENAVDVSALTKNFEELMQQTQKTNTEIITAGEKLNELKGKSKEAADEIEKVATAFLNGYESANINVPKIQELFENLSSNIKGESEMMYDNIILAVSGSLKETLESMGADVPKIIEYLDDLKSSTNLTYDEIIGKYKKLKEERESGKKSEAEYTAELMNLVDELQKVSGEADVVTTSFSDIQKALDKGINWKSKEELTTFLTTLKEKSAEASENAKVASQTIQDLVNEVINIKGEDARGKLGILITAATTLEEEQQKEIKNKLDEYSSLVQNELIKSMEDQFEKGKTEYQSLNFWGKVSASLFGGGNEEGYTKNALKQYIEDYVSPIESELKTAYEGIGATGQMYASETSKSILDSLFATDYISGGGRYDSITTYKSNITDEISKALNGIKKEQKPIAEEAGKNIVQGLADGIEKNVDIPIVSISMLAVGNGTQKGILGTFKEETGINSPSTVFAEFGLNIDQGLANGITDNVGVVTDAMEDMLNALLSKTEGFVEKMRTAMNRFLKEFANSMASISVEDGEVSYSRIPKITIPQFATGGYPVSGEYFFARENGMPELVGRVGRQTAVMNNGQIADTMAQSLIRAMGQGGGVSQPQVIENKLYLDGEVVYSNQQKIQRSKGYNLGMGVFANV